ncbi:MAG: ATP-binding protein [Bacteroides sp.]|nr:ATP-binding protein [Bacteroides sp.]
MNRLSKSITGMALLITILFIGGGIAISVQWYWIALLCLILMLYSVYQLYKLNLKTLRQFRLFTESIRIADSSLSFTPTSCNSLYSSYYNSLNQALTRLNEITQKRECEISFYHNLLNRVDIALLVTTLTHEIIWTNKAARNLLGRPTPKNIHGLKEQSEELAEILFSLPPQTTRILKISREGKIRNIAITLSLFSVKENSLKIYSLKDVQPVVEETENIVWQQLISVLTHEIMNSLSSIISLSHTFSILNTEDDSQEIRKAMSIIHQRSKRLVDFVNNYKRMAQIPVPRKEKLLVKELIEHSISLFTLNNLQIRQLITSDELTLYADRGQMEQVLINLIKNAYEASRNKPEPDIGISAMKHPSGQIIISVSDNGEGIDPEITDKIFMPFYATRPDGSGIGLSICRQIIHLHGGIIAVTSTPDKGSIFTIKL